MRPYLTKVFTVVLLAALFGIPIGFHTERFRQDAMAMSQEEWLEFMQYTQSSYEHSTGFYGMIFVTLIFCIGLVCIYEFTHMVITRIIDKILGPPSKRESAPIKQLYG